jgi:hypothetical protein
LIDLVPDDIESREQYGLTIRRPFCSVNRVDALSPSPNDHLGILGCRRGHGHAGVPFCGRSLVQKSGSPVGRRNAGIIPGILALYHISPTAVHFDSRSCRASKDHVEKISLRRVEGSASEAGGRDADKNEDRSEHRAIGGEEIRFGLLH